MECIYINLDSALARRNNLEHNFNAHKKAGWNLSRFSAINTDNVKENNIVGKIRPAEKACFLSHTSLITKHLNDKYPILVLEDDAIFGDQTCEVIDKFVSDSSNVDWDIIFTDLCVPNLLTMINLMNVRQELASKKQISLIHLNKEKNIVYAGATAYLVNPKSGKKILDLFESENSLDLPYDLYLRRLVDENKINAYVIFPFATSLSVDADLSLLHGDNRAATDITHNAFRRLIWLDRDLPSVLPTLNKLNQDYCDDESLLFGILLGVITSANFKKIRVA